LGKKIGSDWFELEGLPFRGPILEYQLDAFSRVQKIVQFLEKNKYLQRKKVVFKHHYF